MARQRFGGRRPSYGRAEIVEIQSESRGKSVQRRGHLFPDHKAELAALAAAATVPVTVVPEGVRVVTEKQAYVALDANDAHTYAGRHFVGGLQAKLGVRNPAPVEPRPVVEKDDEERAAERLVRARMRWARYWRRKT